MSLSGPLSVGDGAALLSSLVSLREANEAVHHQDGIYIYPYTIRILLDTTICIHYIQPPIHFSINISLLCNHTINRIYTTYHYHE